MVAEIGCVVAYSESCKVVAEQRTGFVREPPYSQGFNVKISGESVGAPSALVFAQPLSSCPYEDTATTEILLYCQFSLSEFFARSADASVLFYGPPLRHSTQERRSDTKTSCTRGVGRAYWEDGWRLVSRCSRVAKIPSVILHNGLRSFLPFRTLNTVAISRLAWSQCWDSIYFYTVQCIPRISQRRNMCKIRPHLSVVQCKRVIVFPAPPMFVC